MTIWECQLKPDRREQTLQALAYTLNRIYLENHRVKRYIVPEEEPAIAAESQADDVVSR